MSNFRFRLQKILELRARAEKDSARKLAEARTGADRAQRVVEELEEAKRTGRGQPVDGEITQVGELQRRALISAQLDDHLAVASDVSRTADEAVSERSAEFSEAHARRRIFDKLKEKHQAEWNGEQELRDRADMDAIAIARHARKKKEG
jgi:flagellar export protein FliJ